MRFFSLQAGGLTNAGARGMPGRAIAGPQRISGAGMLGQASSELIIVLGILLLVILAFVVLSTDTLSSLDSQKASNSARDSVQKLARAADYVYSQGEGASLPVDVIIPSTADTSVGKSYIGKPSSAPADSESNTINMRVSGNDIYAFTSAPLSGAFPVSPGNYRMRVTSHGSYVSVGSGLVDVYPSTIFSTGIRSESKLEQIVIIRPVSPDSASDAVYVTIGYFPEHKNVGLAVDYAFFTAPPGNTPVGIIFSPNDQAAGIYNWVLQVNATACNPYSGRADCASDRFEIPITFEITEG